MLLPHGLRAVQKGPTALTFVGGTTGFSSSSNPTYSINSLTGGIASAPAAGDLVVVVIAILSDVSTTFATSTSGYTKVADLEPDQSYDVAQMGVFYKVLSSAETTVAFTAPANNLFCCHVWRGQNATPLDAATVGSASVTSAQPNAPSITTVTNNAVVLAIGAAGSENSSLRPISNLTVPSGMTNFLQVRPTADLALGIASIARPTAGAYDPPAFGGGNTSATGTSFSAVTMAIRKS